MPHLRSLDEFIVMDYERQEIKVMFPPENIKRAKLLELYRFRPFNKATTSWRSKCYTIPVPEEAKNKNSIATTVI